MLDDVLRIEVLERCDLLQRALAEHVAKGAQHVHAESEGHRVGRHAPHPLHQQRDHQADGQEEQLEHDDTQQQEQQGPGLVRPVAFEQVDEADAADPDDDIGDGQSAQRGEQFAGQYLGAPHGLSQQEIRRPFSLFDRDQREPVVRGLDGQTYLDKEKDEAEIAQNC